MLETVIKIIPMLMGVGASFQNLTEFTLRHWTNAPWVGLANFRAGLDPAGPIGAALLRSVVVTAAYSVVVIAACWVLGMWAASVTSRRFRGRAFFRVLFLIPYALPGFVAITAWRFMLQKDTGSLNALLSTLRLVDSHPFWLIGGNAFTSLVMTSVWRLWPFAFLMLLAGIQGIQPELYEAASTDGATSWQQFRFITLRQLRPVSTVLILMLFLWTFNDFTTPYVLFGDAPPPDADLITSHIYSSTFVNFQFGLGAAMSVLLLVLLIVVSVFYVRLVRAGSETDA